MEESGRRELKNCWGQEEKGRENPKEREILRTDAVGGESGERVGVAEGVGRKRAEPIGKIYL